MSRQAVGPFARWVLLCALALGVVAMHHVGSLSHGDMVAGTAMRATTTATDALSGPTADHATAQSGGAHQSPHEHGMLHLCLAVLCGLLSLVLMLRLLTGLDQAAAPRIRSASKPAPARAPPSRPGRDILLSTCLLRV